MLVQPVLVSTLYSTEKVRVTAHENPIEYHEYISEELDYNYYSVGRDMEAAARRLQKLVLVRIQRWFSV